MIALTLAEIAAAVDGTLVDVADEGATVTGPVEFDSRQVAPGGLFVALPGEQVDGHDYAAAAVERGAVAVLATRPVGVPSVVVAEPFAALASLARSVLARLPEVTVVGITGSAGKTTTKDLVAALVRRIGPTVAPPGSFNNELGHPYTVLRSTVDTRFLVLENSARGPGHIAALCRIARPTIGVVLNVGSAHLGEFGSRAAIAAAKGELVEALPAAAEGGVAVLNADDPLVAAMRDRTAARVLTVGESPGADLRAVDVVIGADGRPSFRLVTPEEEVGVRLALVGRHQVANSLAAAAVAHELGLGWLEIADVLAETGAASHWRMEVTERPDGVTIVNDAYNANPESMRVALETLATLARGRRGWAVLGPMAELGEETAAAHDAVGRLVAELGIARLVVVGGEAAPMHVAATRDGSWEGESVLVPEVDAARALLDRELRPGDVVLVKASRSAGLERVALALGEVAAPAAPIDAEERR
ncbi:MAG TPA: UDP-N-acetylmuramoyl-tripeptide--D-alanyl-D-alanine ligase [Mycobacteriales bacterium]